MPASHIYSPLWLAAHQQRVCNSSGRPSCTHLGAEHSLRAAHLLRALRGARRTKVPSSAVPNTRDAGAADHVPVPTRRTQAGNTSNAELARLAHGLIVEQSLGCRQCIPAVSGGLLRGRALGTVRRGDIAVATEAQDSSADGTEKAWATTHTHKVQRASMKGTPRRLCQHRFTSSGIPLTWGTSGAALAGSTVAVVVRATGAGRPQAPHTVLAGYTLRNGGPILNKKRALGQGIEP
jgi:hypothetical protein